MAEFDHDGWLNEIRSRVEVGPFTLTKTNKGDVRLSVGSDDHFVWSWPTTSSYPSNRADFGEELATALSLVDGRFEVRSRQHG